MGLIDQIISALFQLGAVLLIGALAFAFYRIKKLKKGHGQTFLQFAGLSPARNQLDLMFLAILFAVILFGIGSTYLQYEFSDTMRSLLMSESSPYGKILKSGFSFSSIFAAFVYCFIQASASEELLFRGLIAKRLYRSWGFAIGNLIQAALFGLMHIVIFRFITGEWFSFAPVLAFLTSFGLGLVFGYANSRKAGESVFPSWILHGSVNYVSFLTLAMISK